MVPSARLELALQKGTDFKSVVSTNFTTRAPVFFMLYLYIFITQSVIFKNNKLFYFFVMKTVKAKSKLQLLE